MCFSRKSDLLSQWRGYGDDAKGVSIGFNLKNNNIFNDKEIITSTDRYHFMKEGNYFLYSQEVRYDDSEFIKKLISVCKDMSGDVKNHLFNVLIDLDIVTKHPYFQEEDEVRLIYTPENYVNSSASDKENLIAKISSLQFRTSNSKLIPFYKLDISDNLEIIKEIRLGPKCSVDKDILKTFLNTNGFTSVEIISSNAPYQ